MRFSSSSPSARYHTLGPLFFNDQIIGVTDRGYVLGSVPRRSVTAVRTEYRTSFKHPILGSLVGLVMTVLPAQGLAGDPLNLWWFVLGSCYGWPASLFLISLGSYLLWGALTRHDEPWLVFVTPTGSRAFPLRHELPPDALATLQSLLPSPDPASPTTPFPHESRCPTCGYDLRATPDRCPECGTSPSHP